MAKQEPVVQAVASLVRANICLAGALSCALAWAFLVRFSGLLVEPGATVGQSGAASIAALATLLAGVAAVPRPQSVRGILASVIAGALCAIAATLALTAGPLRGAQGFAPYVLNGVLQGGAYLAATAAALDFYRRLGFRASLVVAAAACTGALGIFVLVCGLLPRELAWLMAALPVASAGLAVAALRGRLAQGPLGPRVSDPSVRVKPAVLGVLMVLAGLLAAYMPVMYPKTTNIAAQSLAAAECLGMASWRCVAALALFVGLLWLSVAIVYRRRRAVTVAVLCAMVLLAAIFFMLPSMGTSAVAFVLFVACGLVAGLFAVAFLVCCAPLDPRQGARALRRGLAVAMGGSLVASVFAFVFLGPLYNVTVFQDTLFSVVPAVLLLGFAGVLFGLRRPVAEALRAWGVLGGPSVPAAAAADGDRFDLEAFVARYGLTKREAEVLALLAEGRNEPYVESALGISRTTVKTHITHIYRKVGVSSRQQLIDVLRG